MVNAITRPSSLGTLLFALLAVAALLQSTLLVMIDPTLLGWRPDHGHIYAGGRVIPHHHPWDPPQAGITSSDTARSASTSASTAGVTFTGGDDSVTGSVASALSVPSSPVVLPALVSLFGVSVARVAHVDVPADVPAPPPRG